MNETVIMWLLGSGGAIAISLLGLIWSELRAMRESMERLSNADSRHDIRLTNVEEVIKSLPCYHHFRCPHEGES